MLHSGDVLVSGGLQAAGLMASRAHLGSSCISFISSHFALVLTILIGSFYPLNCGCPCLTYPIPTKRRAIKSMLPLYIGCACGARR